MKKILALTLAVIMLAAVLCACGPKDPVDTTTDGAGTTTEGTGTQGGTEVTTTKGGTTVVEPDTKFDADNIVLSFGALSDVHCQDGQTMPTSKFLSALNQLKDYAAKSGDKNGLDAVAIAGDLTQSGRVSEARMVKDTYQLVFDETEVPLIFTTGNHEELYGGVLLMSDMLSIFGKSFFESDLTEYATDFKNGSRLCKVGDYYFIFINPDSNGKYYKVNGVAAPYAASTKEWLDNTLKTLTEKDPGKSVFLFTHPMIHNTVYGSDLYTADNLMWYTTDLTDILSKYPQVVTFSGHLHFPLNDPRSIMQTDFTSLGCGSVRYMAIEDGNYIDMSSKTVMKDCNEYSQGLLVQVDANGNIRFTRMDFYNKTTIGEEWEISAPKADKSHLLAYPKNRSEKNAAPVLAEDAISFEFGTAGKTSVNTTVKFKSATDDEFAHHYILTINRVGSQKVSTKKVLADFYRHGDPADMKKEWEVNLGNLTIGNEYEVTLVAVDSWGAESNKVTAKVKAEGGKPAEVNKTELYVDIDFPSSGMTDTKGNVTVTNNGAEIGKFEVSHAGKKYTVNALHATSGKHAICKFNSLASASDFRKFAEGNFSVEAFYVAKSSTGKVQGIVCGTQAGGWGLAEQASGQPYFITGGSGGLNGYNPSVVAGATASRTELTHVVATYDFAEKKSYIYINGKLSASASINEGFKVGAGSTFNYFCLGDDITASLVGGDFPAGDMIIADAKIYTGALTAEEVSTAYASAVANLSK